MSQEFHSGSGGRIDAFSGGDGTEEVSRVRIAMPNFLRRLGLQGLHAPLPHGSVLLGYEADPSDPSDETLWRMLAEQGARSPVLAAYEDGHRSWFLAFSEGGPAEVITLRSDVEWNPDAPWRVPAHVVPAVVEDLSAALGEDAEELQEDLEEGEPLYPQGREILEPEAWRRVPRLLTEARAELPLLVWCEPKREGRRFACVRGREHPVGHEPVPATRWSRLSRLVSDTDAEALYRRLLYRR